MYILFHILKHIYILNYVHKYVHTKMDPLLLKNSIGNRTVYIEMQNIERTPPKNN